MKHVTIQALTLDLPAAALILAELGVFDPDSRSGADEALPDNPGQRYRELHRQAQGRLEKIGNYLGPPSSGDRLEPRPVSEADLADTNDWLGKAWQVCSQYEEDKRALLDREREIEQLQSTLDNFRELDIDLGLLQEKRRFLDIHIGSVPLEHVRHLRDAVSLDGYLLFIYMENRDRAHVVIIGPGEARSQHLLSVLDTAGYRAFALPPELHAKPEQVAQTLARQRADLRGQEQQLEQRFNGWRRMATAEFMQAAGTLQLAAPYVALGESAQNRGNLAQMRGWVPAADIPKLQQTLQRNLAHPFVLQARDPRPEEHRLVPSVLRHNRWLQAFSILVTQYGVPRYGELNPTSLFAFTYVCMFGMMFGDVGHGAVILLLALLARRRLGSFTFFAVTAGLSSILFGFLYGSLFGYEHILPAVWISPLSDPLYMMGVALLWGIGFLTLIGLLNILNHLLSGDLRGALFANNGLLSLLFYAGLLILGFGFYRQTDSGPWGALLAWLSLTGLFAYNLQEQQGALSERLLVALIETFETIIGYISNTLSFLRVAAFSLNHVALAIAVFTLADLMGQTGHWVMVVFGNLFILVLEGAIVTIQVLRLEYYEGFTRFFAGDGKAFRPLKL
jgi:V/A-type H+-transporting ATPase subunit I